MLDAPSSWRHAILARRKECGPRPGKSQPSTAAARLGACRTPESHSGRALLSVRVKTHFSGCARSAAAWRRERSTRYPNVRGRFLVFDFGSSMSSRQLRCTMRQTPLCKIHMWRSSGLQLDVRLVIRGEGKSLKRFGGPGEIRTHDLFHAMEARSQLRHRPGSVSFEYTTAHARFDMPLARLPTMV